MQGIPATTHALPGSTEGGTRAHGGNGIRRTLSCGRARSPHAGLSAGQAGAEHVAVRGLLAAAVQRMAGPQHRHQRRSSCGRNSRCGGCLPRPAGRARMGQGKPPPRNARHAPCVRASARLPITTNVHACRAHNTHVQGCTVRCRRLRGSCSTCRSRAPAGRAWLPPLPLWQRGACTCAQASQLIQRGGPVPAWACRARRAAQRGVGRISTREQPGRRAGAC